MSDERRVGDMTPEEYATYINASQYTAEDVLALMAERKKLEEALRMLHGTVMACRLDRGTASMRVAMTKAQQALEACDVKVPMCSVEGCENRAWTGGGKWPPADFPAGLRLCLEDIDRLRSGSARRCRDDGGVPVVLLHVR